MSNAPTGIVTLVFTDIEGSTVLWEHLGKAFKPVLDLHNQIFREAIAEFGGYEVKTEGDAFMVAPAPGGSLQQRIERRHCSIHGKFCLPRPIFGELTMST